MWGTDPLIHQMIHHRDKTTQRNARIEKFYPSPTCHAGRAGWEDSPSIFVSLLVAYAPLHNATSHMQQLSITEQALLSLLVLLHHSAAQYLGDGLFAMHITNPPVRLANEVCAGFQQLVNINYNVAVLHLQTDMMHCMKQTIAGAQVIVYAVISQLSDTHRFSCSTSCHCDSACLKS